MDNERTVRQMFDRINSGDIDGAVAFLADDFVEHEEAPGIPPTKEGTKQLFTMLRGGFPDLRFDAEDIFSSGERVVARSIVSGTHQNAVMGIPATGKRIAVADFAILRFGDDGLIHDHWGLMDMMTMMQQLGVLPG
jgi:steroid delta-isomerase-like uncharacterized protein